MGHMGIDLDGRQGWWAMGKWMRGHMGIIMHKSRWGQAHIPNAVDTCHMYPWPNLDPQPLASRGGLSNVPESQKMSSCQKYVKCQKIKYLDYGGGSQKINWHNEVHRYWCQFWHHTWWSPKPWKMFLESFFGQFWWTSYLMSKLMSILMSISVNLIMSSFFTNLLHSPDVWLFDIWHLFDNLTSFDIWHI